MAKHGLTLDAIEREQADLERLKNELLEALAIAQNAQANQLTASELGRRGGLKGGPARARSLSSKRRSEIAKKAINTRWERERAKKAAGGR